MVMVTTATLYYRFFHYYDGNSRTGIIRFGCVRIPGGILLPPWLVSGYCFFIEEAVIIGDLSVEQIQG